MAQTQFFTRKSDNLEEYKSSFNKALQKIKTVKLFSEEVTNFLETWIDAQKNYIPRKDVDNLWKHLNILYKNKDFYDYLVWELQEVKNNWKIQEYSFNLISCLNESAKKFKAFEKKRKIKENLEKSKEKSKLDDERQMKKILSQLE